MTATEIAPELSTAARRPHRGRDRDLPGAAARQQGHVGAGAHARRRGDVELAGRRAARGVAQPRPRLEDLRRRRQRVLRLPRWVRRLARRPRPPGHRRGGPRPRVARGTHFAQPTEDSIVVADNLAERFGQPLWRFGNSGTESTMDAVHLMRAATGRDRILKVEGCYHGHHDSVMVSVLPEVDDDHRPRRRADRDHRQQRHPRRDHRPDHDRAVQRPGRRPARARSASAARSPA